jgi:hypothetical protein
MTPPSPACTNIHPSAAPIFRAFHDAAYGPLLSTSPVRSWTPPTPHFRPTASTPVARRHQELDRRAPHLHPPATQRVASSFEFTVNNGNNFSTSQNLVTLSGSAPVQVKTIKINGVAYPVKWTSVNTWTMQYALEPGANLLNLEAYDSYGNRIDGPSRTRSPSPTPAHPISPGLSRHQRDHVQSRQSRCRIRRNPQPLHHHRLRSLELPPQRCGTSTFLKAPSSHPTDFSSPSKTSRVQRRLRPRPPDRRCLRRQAR